MAVAWGWEKWGIENYCVMGIKFQFYKRVIGMERSDVIQHYECV